MSARNSPDTILENQTKFLSKVLEDSLSVDKLLGHEASGGQHGKTTVLKLLGLHGLQLLGVGGLEAKGVEPNVTRGVGLTEKTWLGDGDILGLYPSDFGTGLLGGANGDGQENPENWGNLGKVADGRAADLGVEQERGALDLFADEESDSGKHGNAAVGQLGLTVALHGGFVGLVSESEGIKESHRGKSTWKLLSDESVEGGGLLDRNRSKGGGRADEGEEGGGELHCCYCLFVLFVFANVRIVRRRMVMNGDGAAI